METIRHTTATGSADMIGTALNGRAQSLPSPHVVVSALLFLYRHGKTPFNLWD